MPRRRPEGRNEDRQVRGLPRRLRVGDLFVPEDQHRRGSYRLVGIPRAPPARRRGRDPRHGRAAASARTRARSAASMPCSIPSRAPCRAGSTRTPPAQSSTPASTSRARRWACPCYELFGGAVRDRIPVYWSRCGVIRARCAEYFDGKVIDRPAVRTVDDLEAAAREARDRGYKAIKCNLLVFDENGGRQYTPGSARGPGHPELNLPGGDARRADRTAHRAARGRRPRASASRSISTSTTRPKASAASPRRSNRST